MEAVIGFGVKILFWQALFSGHFRRTSFRRLNGHWSNGLEGSRVGRGDRFPVLQRVRRGRSIITQLAMDTNISSGHLTYLSYFKPQEEKLKPVTLPFERPLVDMEKKITEVSLS